VDPEGNIAWIVPVAGGVIGGVTNAVLNYGDYRAGRITGWGYARSIGFGTLMGAASTLGSGVSGAALMGGATAAANDAYNQKLRREVDPCLAFDWSGVGLTFMKGAGIGMLGALGSKGGWYIVKIPDVLYKGQSLINYGNAGGLIGNIIGTIFSNRRNKEEGYR
jgi:hypothetical protein